MPQEGGDAVSQAGQGVNWLVGLSGAAIGGALAKLDWVLKFPGPAKRSFLIAAALFFVSIVLGVFYAFQLFYLKSQRQKVEAAKAVLLAADNAQNRADLDTKQKDLDTEQKKANKYFYGIFLAFVPACVLTIACLYYVMYRPWAIDPPVVAQIPPNKYTITNVPVHASGRLSHSHTFLLNQQTGEVWQMTCQKGNLVEFRRVPRTDLRGLLEDTLNPSQSKTGAGPN